MFASLECSLGNTLLLKHFVSVREGFSVNAYVYNLAFAKSTQFHPIYKVGCTPNFAVLS